MHLRYDIAVLPNGKIVVCWTNIYSDLFQIKMFEKDGTLFRHFSISINEPGLEKVCVLTSLEDGGFVVAYETTFWWNFEYHNTVAARRFDSLGVEVTPEWELETFTTHHQADLSITSLNDGGFIIMYLGIQKMIGKRFNSSSGAVSEFIIQSVFIEGSLTDPIVASLIDGWWISVCVEKFIYYTVIQTLYNSMGDVVPVEKYVVQDLSSLPEPRVTSLSDGNWIVCWMMSNIEIICQQFNHFGRVGKEITVPRYGSLLGYDIASLPNGGWVVVLVTMNSEYNFINVTAFDPPGVPYAQFDIDIISKNLGYFLLPHINSCSDGGFCVSFMFDDFEGPDIPRSQCFSTSEIIIEEPTSKYWCWNAWSDQSFVCSGHGTCIGTNQCQCDINYSGKKCDYFSCFGVSKNSPDVCSGFGKCIDHNVCVCNPGYSNPLGACNSCDNSNCHGVGNCVIDSPNVYHCENCGTGISGVFCEDCIVSGKSGKQQDNVCFVSYAGRMDLDWQESRDYCKINFHPASDIPVLPNSESLSVFRQVTDKRNAWILLSDGEGSWEWKDGVTPYGWTNWNLKKPDNRGDCAYVHRRNGKYMNHFCNSQKATEAVTCSIDMNDINATFSSNALLNVGYRKYDFSSGWCDWSIVDNCPDTYQLCNGIKQGTEGVCSNNGTCTYFPSERKNKCVCSTGYTGIDCEAVDEPISGMDCKILNGYCYKHFKLGKKGVGWNVARDYCKDNWDLAADLATIPNWEVQELISTLIGDYPAWIGALDFVEGTWEWVDHSPMTFTNWHVKDDGGKFGDDCAAIEPKKYFDNGWSTNNCASPKAFVCSLKISDAGNGASSVDWINVRYKNLNTASASCSCSNLPCPSSGC